MDTSLSKPPEIVDGREAWPAAVRHPLTWGHRVGRDLVTEQKQGHAPATGREGEKKIQIFHFEEKFNLIQDLGQKT